MRFNRYQIIAIVIGLVCTIMLFWLSCGAGYITCDPPHMRLFYDATYEPNATVEIGTRPDSNDLVIQIWTDPNQYDPNVVALWIGTWEPFANALVSSVQPD